MKSTVNDLDKLIFCLNSFELKTITLGVLKGNKMCYCQH